MTPAETLTPKEKRIVELVAEGLTNREIGALVGNTEHTIRNRLRFIFDKLGMDTRLEVAMWYERRRATS